MVYTGIVIDIFKFEDMWAARRDIYAPTVYPAMQIVKSTLVLQRAAALIPLSVLSPLLRIFIPPYLFPRVGEGEGEGGGFITVYLCRYFHLITILVRDSLG